MGMHVLHIIRDLDKTSGGPSRSVPALVEALGETGASQTVLFGDRGRETTVSAINSDANYVSIRRAAGPLRLMRDARELSALHTQHAIDVIHSHGLWCGLNHAAARFARQHHIPFVITPRGMLEPWCLNQKRFKKQFALWLYQRKDLEQADVLHATSDAEAVQLRNLGLGEKISVIPNGTEFPGAVFNKSTDRRSRRLLFLSRLHPVKGIDNLIRAWSLIAPKDWECVIAGPDEGGYLAELKRLHEELGSIDSIRFEDEVEGAVKWKTLSSADLFVLPSHSENFGIVVAEALACGVPVITTKCTPWRELESHSCGWWIEDNVEVLTETLKRALATSSSELSEMGKRGRSLVNRTYTWSSVAKQMKSVYSTILYKTQVSPSVFWGN